MKKKQRPVLTQLTSLFQQPLSGNSEWENAITKSIGVSIAADLRPFSIVAKQGFFLIFHLTEPYRPVQYRDLKNKTHTEPWLLCTVTLGDTINQWRIPEVQRNVASSKLVFLMA